MKDNSMEAMQASSFLSGGSAAYLETLYEKFLSDPSSIEPHWRECFEKFPDVAGHSGKDFSHESLKHEFAELAKMGRVHAAEPLSGDISHERKQGQVLKLIDAYRSHGHHHASLDPLVLKERGEVPDLKLNYYGFTPQDKQTQFNTEDFMGLEMGSLDTIHHALQETYCGNIGIEYRHISNVEETKWLQNQFETNRATPNFNQEQQNRILDKLTEAEGLEKYLGSKFVGQKRFSLEGGDSLIPALDTLIESAGEFEIKECLIGMAHRGRLNVLVNILGKSPETLFQEFKGSSEKNSRSGDVKYHMGYSSDVMTQSGHGVHLTLAFNPSHLEIISPVVIGSARARQRRRRDMHHNQVLPILIHGDAAVAGQGVVMETFNMSQARGFAVGGSLHIVINNQVGFTTSNPLDSRSTLYCTDIAKMVQAPVFHVNGDDPEAVVMVTKIALAYRMKFKKDVVIDLVCYRRHGHNEADEPSITQPVMYSKIRKHLTPRQLYAEYLIEKNIITKEISDKKVSDFRDALDKGQQVVKILDHTTNEFASDWTPYIDQDWTVKHKTAISKKEVVRLGKIINKYPDDFAIQPQVKREFDNRNKMIAGELPLNWGCAENLAYASLVDEGFAVRLCGQDSGRGTFTHRHAVLYNQEDRQAYIPLSHVSDKQGDFIVIDSILSEEAVLAFEYGYGTTEPKALLLWEAQFGDFANGAQVVIDQFISSGEQKWGRLCGLTMLLPHGFEGMGPEHSSARLERYLQLCAEQNIQVCVPSTPAQCFHMLRRQMVRPYRKPLIVMTPKSLLRHKLAVSSLDDLTKGEFQVVIDEVDDLNKANINRLILCSGKVYYDILEKRRELKQDKTAIIRIEQLYPFPEKILSQVLKNYPKVKDIIWCQEEPENQGAWYSSQHHIRHCLTGKQVLHYVGRDASASPAVGSALLHIEQQKKLVDDALNKTF